MGVQTISNFSLLHLKLKSIYLSPKGMEGKILVEVYDFDDDGGHDFIGSFECSARELLSSIDRQWDLRSSKSRLQL